MQALVTGAAGFIGFHVASRLLERGDAVVGLDSLNAYYDPALKRARLAELRRLAEAAGGRFSFVEADLADRAALEQVFASHRFDRVVNLAAQAGIRYSLDHPESYVDSNLVGFANLLEACRQAQTPHFVFASSSSVYGRGSHPPFDEGQAAVHPMQLYAATKRANELMAHSYAHLFGLPATGLRYFTVYGPWGRPDMSLFKFTRLILDGGPIELSNHGRHTRDFTYIDDAVAATVLAIDNVAGGRPGWSDAAPDPGSSEAPFAIYNVGSGDPVPLVAIVETLERAIGIEAKKRLVERSPADMIDTHADITRIGEAFGYAPTVAIDEGIERFVRWFKSHYAVG